MIDKTCLLTNSGQLFAGQHIYNARSAKARYHRNDPGGFSYNLSDHARVSLCASEDSRNRLKASKVKK
jgi:hypothetical protein